MEAGNSVVCWLPGGKRISKRLWQVIYVEFKRAFSFLKSTRKKLKTA